MSFHQSISLVYISCVVKPSRRHSDNELSLLTDELVSHCTVSVVEVVTL